MTEDRFAQVCIEHGRRLEAAPNSDALMCDYPGHGRLGPWDAFAVFDRQKQLVTSIATPAKGEHVATRYTLAELAARWRDSPERVELEREANKPGAIGAGQRRSAMGKPLEVRKHEVAKLEKQGCTLFVRLVLAKAKRAAWRVTWTRVSAKSKKTTGISFLAEDEAGARTAFNDQVAKLRGNGWKEAAYGRGVKVTPIPIGVD